MFPPVAFDRFASSVLTSRGDFNVIQQRQRGGTGLWFEVI